MVRGRRAGAEAGEFVLRNDDDERRHGKPDESVRRNSARQRRRRRRRVHGHRAPRLLLHGTTTCRSLIARRTPQFRFRFRSRFRPRALGLVLETKGFNSVSRREFWSRLSFFIYYKQQRANRPLTCCNIQQCVHDTVFELRKISFAIF